MPDQFQEQDPFSPIAYSYPGASVLHRERTPYQELAVLEHPHFGRMLVLDGVVQLTERDEFFYHEMLAHPVLHVHPAPQAVLIIGGGDGGSLRETLKHSDVSKITLVEIDERVIAASRAFFPTLNMGFDDPRVTVVHDDGAAYVARPPHPYDVLIVDSTDPVGPAAQLSTPAFFRAAAAALGPEGMFVAQSESLHFHLGHVAEVQRRLRAAFPVADCYTQAIATYAGNWWAFAMGSKAHSPRRPRTKPGVRTRYYSAEVHRRAFLPRGLYRRLLAGSLDW